MGRRGRPKTGPREPRPNLRKVVFADGSAVVFEVPKGTTTRGAVQIHGRPRFVCAGRRWKPWPHAPAPAWARSWGKPKQLNEVPLAEPDPVRAQVPAAFAVDAARWCAWPVAAREALRFVAVWTKRAGAMATGLLDAQTAERVRGLVARHSLEGLEESPLACEMAGGVR